MFAGAMDAFGPEGLDPGQIADYLVHMPMIVIVVVLFGSHA
jgi:hypothetical protein